jgi:hypothetical protein
MFAVGHSDHDRLTQPPSPWIGVHRPVLAARVAFLTGEVESGDSLATLDCPIIGKPFELGALRHFAAEWEAAAAQD